MRRTRLVLACYLLYFASTSSVAEEGKIYTFGVVPQQSAKKLARLWTPILKEVSALSGVALQFRTAKNIPTFEKRLANGEYDFAYMNPYHYTVFSETPGYEAIAKRKNQKIKGIIVARKDRAIDTLDALDSAKLAFPSPAAFGATVLPQAQLKQANVVFTPHYVSSHDSVYLSVAKGLFPAGGGVLRTLKSIDEDLRDQLKIVWTTKAYTPHAFTVHPKVDVDTKTRIQSAIIELVETDKGRTLLHSLRIKNGIEKAEDTDWDDVRAITSTRDR